MNRIKISLLILPLLFLLAEPAFGQEVEWSIIRQEGRPCLQLTIPEQLAASSGDKALTVFVGQFDAWPGENVRNVIGTTGRVQNSLTFVPAFPFREGVAYTAFWGKEQSFFFDIPQVGPTTELTAIYPSAAILPANLLKIYLHFSAAMGEGHAYENLRLLSTSGDTIDQPFVPLQPELWSPDRRRLTLWLDPGRVKRGLLSHETHGVVIGEGQRCTLLIDAGWKDAAGKPLGRTYRKSFQVGAPDYAVPDPAQWEVAPPPAGSTEPLVVRFGEPLDEALSRRLITVEDPQGRMVSGSVHLAEAERRWEFRPDQNWRAGVYQLRVDSALEDLAGNNLSRPFDRDLSAGGGAVPSAADRTVRFRVGRSE